MDDGSYSTNLNKIIQTARGPLTDIEDFQKGKNVEIQNIIIEEQTTGDVSEVRSKLRKLAAIMAVLSIPKEESDVKASIGRQLGSAWAQDHRLTAMGLPGIANRRAKRSTWR